MFCDNEVPDTIKGEANPPQGTALVTTAEGFLIGLSRYDGSEDILDEEIANGDCLKFHFQLRGFASYEANGQKNLNVEDFTTVLVLHGEGVKKSSCIAAVPHFSVTIVCQPDVFIHRFGIEKKDVLRPVLRHLDYDDVNWFAEKGKMTPEMIFSVRALETMNFQGQMRQAYIEARATELLCELWGQIAGGRIHQSQGIDDKTLFKIEKTREYIDANYADVMTVQMLARNVATNETNLSMAFRKLTGMTLFEYIRTRRMEKAQKLLRTGRWSVTQIAFEVGYEHPCNFSVAYKRHFGISPKEDKVVRT